MRNNPAFIKFVKERSDLLERSTDLRSQIDNWIENKADDPSIGDLAAFQALLLDRAHVLNELINIDYQMMELLLAERAARVRP